MVPAIAQQQPVGPPRGGRLYTPIFMASFCHLDRPWAGADGKGNPTYCINAIFHDDANLGPMRTELDKALINKFGPQAPQLVGAGVYRYPLRPKALNTKYRGYDGAGYFMSLHARPDNPPACIDMSKGGKVLLQPGAIESAIYPGCYCYCTFAIYAYANVGKGVGVGLRTLVKIADGENIGGPTPVSREEALAATQIELPAGLTTTYSDGPLLQGVKEETAPPWQSDVVGHQALLDALR